MKRILYSGIGTTDPVRGMRDGGLMHILRHYRPDTVYLFLTREMSALDAQDGRFRKMFDFIRENWDGYAPEVVRFETEIDDPSDMDAVLQPMDELLQQILSAHPGTEILLNLSSGTPQMKIILAQFALDARYPVCGIQVKSPEKKSGTTERTNVRYPVEEALALNEDEEPDAPNRCSAPKMIAVRREAVRSRLKGLVAQRNYAAIAQMSGELPPPALKLAQHLDYRSRFRLEEAEEAAAGFSGLKMLSGLKLHPGKESLPYDVYRLVEYFGVLKNLVYLKRYTDFVLRLNPFVVRLQKALLEQVLRSRRIPPEAVLLKDNGWERLSLRDIPEGTELESRMTARFGSAQSEWDISIPSLNVLLRYFLEDDGDVRLLECCETLNQKLRNPAAHELFSVSDRQIQELCGRDAEGIVRGLEALLLKTLERFDARGLQQRLTVYERCDRVLADCI